MYKTIDRAIKESWLYNISSDYASDYLLLEDTLKNVFYYHLRSRITDDFLKRHNLRIFTELHTGNSERIDLAIVRVDPDIDSHLQNKIIEYIAVIELKYKAGQVPVNPFLEDIRKMQTYIKRNQYKNCQYYIGFIHEVEYGLDETGWLHTRAQKTWAKGKLTELSGFYNEGKMNFIISSYNDINDDLNHVKVIS